MFFKHLALLGSICYVVAQRPSDISICDYYTTALLRENSAANQHTLLTLVVNTAAIGNYTTPNVGVKVTGILNKGMYNGTPINLLPYFDGGFVSTNNGTAPSVMNFLDGGGAAALAMSLPAFDNTSNQYFLLTHLYEYFGILLGCSQVGISAAFPAYGGDVSMYDVHKYMALSADDVAYFITQVGNSALSFGVTQEDATAVGDALTKLFNYRCIAPEVVIPDEGLQLNSICLAESCPLDPINATCSLYDNMDGYSPQPATYNFTMIEPSSTIMPCSMTVTTTVYISSCPMTSNLPPTSTEMSSSTAPPASSSCPTTLTGDFQFPHLIVPISSEYPTQAFGTSFFGEINSTVSTVFNFDFPESYAGAQCSLVFLFPMQSQLQTSSFTLSGSGAIEFHNLVSPATLSTSYSNIPPTKENIATINVAPGNSYVLANYPCPAGTRVSIVAMAEGDVSLSYFQDYNPSPIGLYITKC